MHDTRHAWARWLWLTLAVAALDLATKAWVTHSFELFESRRVTPFFNLVLVHNQGAAFSFLADAGGWQRYFFIALAVAVCVALAWMLRKPMPLGEAVAFSLIIGGALANALDRSVRGYVVDFLDFHWRGWHWPAFNVADIAITSGAALLILSTFLYGTASREAHD